MSPSALSLSEFTEQAELFAPLKTGTATGVVTAGPIPTSPTSQSGPSAVQVWTLIVALCAVAATLISAALLRRTGRETSKAASGSAEAAKASAAASQRAAKAAEDSVTLNARTARASANRADSEALAKRYQDAAQQLGHERAAVRLAGVYAMARLADDWPDQRQTCVDVLCAYLRMPSDPAEGADALAEREVRATVLQAIMTRLAKNLLPGQADWRTCRFDLGGAVLNEARFVDLRFEEEPSFQSATFTGLCSFSRCEFVGGVNLGGIVVSGSLFIDSCETTPSRKIDALYCQVKHDSRLNLALPTNDGRCEMDFSYLSVEGGEVDIWLPPDGTQSELDMSDAVIEPNSVIKIGVTKDVDRPRVTLLHGLMETWSIAAGARIMLDPKVPEDHGWVLPAEAAQNQVTLERYETFFDS